jgi:hypothetical protein
MGIADTRALHPPLSYKQLLIILRLGPEIEIGGLYDPTLLPDFDPSSFCLTTAKLAQQDVHGIDGNLMGPWDMAENLRPGTLVAIEAKLIVYSFCKPSDPSTVSVSIFPYICDFLILTPH